MITPTKIYTLNTYAGSSKALVGESHTLGVYLSMEAAEAAFREGPFDPYAHIVVCNAGVLWRFSPLETYMLYAPVGCSSNMQRVIHHVTKRVADWVDLSTSRNYAVFARDSAEALSKYRDAHEEKTQCYTLVYDMNGDPTRGSMIRGVYTTLEKAEDAFQADVDLPLKDVYNVHIDGRRLNDQTGHRHTCLLLYVISPDSYKQTSVVLPAFLWDNGRDKDIPRAYTAFATTPDEARDKWMKRNNRGNKQ